MKLYFGSNITQRNILDLFTDADIKISAGQLSNLLIKDQEVFHQEKDALYKAGLNSSPWQHIPVCVSAQAEMTLQPGSTVKTITAKSCATPFTLPTLPPSTKAA